MKTMTLREAVGNLLVVGVESTSLSAMERAWLRVVRPSGIILFRRNIEDARQTRALLEDASQACATHPMRCVDVEGGTVDRLRDALAAMPAAQAVAQSGNAAMAREQGRLTARAVRAFGMNTTLAPVLDLGLPESQTIRGTRAAAADAEGVTAYTRAFLKGLQDEGVTGCGKHFPGLGGGTLDSHKQMPEIERSMEQLESEDMAPYRALRRELPMVMVGHGAYPRTDGGSAPASQSPFWIETVLRQRIGYRGLVFSDDMEMGGVLGARPIEEAAVTAVLAGMDVMEICHSAELILRAFEALLLETEQSVIFRRRVMTRARCVAAWRAQRFAHGVGTTPTAEELASLRAAIEDFSRRVAEDSATRHRA